MNVPNAPAVLVEQQDHVLLVTINRPEARNAVNLAVATALGDAAQRADDDPDVWAVVLTGAGSHAFCAGADLKAVSRGEPITPDDGRRRSWGFAGWVSHPISKPTIAAVNGFALGGGTEVVLASDLVVAAEHASFGLPEVRRGLYAAGGGAFRLPQQISPKLAMEMMLTGEPISADRALQLGLVNHVVAATDTVEAAIALARKICGNAPLAVQASKRIALGMVDGRIPADDPDWLATGREYRALMSSTDAQEGPRAFAEKRTPRWTGR